MGNTTVSSVLERMSKGHEQQMLQLGKPIGIRSTIKEFKQHLLDEGMVQPGKLKLFIGNKRVEDLLDDVRIKDVQELYPNEDFGFESEPDDQIIRELSLLVPQIKERFLARNPAFSTVVLDFDRVLSEDDKKYNPPTGSIPISCSFFSVEIPYLEWVEQLRNRADRDFNKYPPRVMLRNLKTSLKGSVRIEYRPPRGFYL